ncbi:MAG: hypothetical protein K0U98_01925, partial [Deltaproteobacteria bacterium]|nr:hypothetical protein [Deltaproteobacteria bacterium]
QGASAIRSFRGTIYRCPSKVREVGPRPLGLRGTQLGPHEYPIDGRTLDGLAEVVLDNDHGAKNPSQVVYIPPTRAHGRFRTMDGKPLWQSAQLWLISVSLLGALLPVVAMAQSEGYLGMSLPSDFRPFRADSPWNTPIPADAEIHPDSALMIDFLVDTLRDLGTSDHVAINVVSWTSPIHLIDSSVAPRIDIQTTGDSIYWSTDPDGNGVAENIPMPEIGPWQDPQTDGHMIMVDLEVMRAWEFSRATPLGGGAWRASVIDTWDLKGPGWRTAFVSPSWWRSGSVASGLSRLAGTVRPEEVQAGVIDHPLLVLSPTNRSSSLPGGADNELCPPASRSDGWGVGSHFIPEGALLQLDPDLDLDELDLSNPAKVVARAMQIYGMYVFDNGPTFAVPFQNLGPTGGIWASPELIGIVDVRNIPVEHFRVLRCETVAKDPTFTVEESVEFVTSPGMIVAGEVMDPIVVRLVDGNGQPVFTGREFEVMLNIGMWEGTSTGHNPNSWEQGREARTVVEQVTTPRVEAISSRSHPFSVPFENLSIAHQTPKMDGELSMYRSTHISFGVVFNPVW